MRDTLAGMPPRAPSSLVVALLAVALASPAGAQTPGAPGTPAAPFAGHEPVAESPGSYRSLLPPEDHRYLPELAQLLPGSYECADPDAPGNLVVDSVVPVGTIQAVDLDGTARVLAERFRLTGRVVGPELLRQILGLPPGIPPEAVGAREVLTSFQAWVVKGGGPGRGRPRIHGDFEVRVLPGGVLEADVLLEPRLGRVGLVLEFIGACGLPRRIRLERTLVSALREGDVVGKPPAAAARFLGAR